MNFKKVDKSMSPTFEISFRTAAPDDSDSTICRQQIHEELPETQKTYRISQFI